jgi:4-hydroxy-tetrahydrodipicolinate reductase
MPKSHPTKILMVGSKGRMGQTILHLAAEDPAFEITGSVDQNDNVLDRLDYCDVVIDFSHHAVTLPLAQIAAAHGKALVIGTTGHNAGEKAEIAEAAKEIPMIFAPNFSVGVNLLFYLTRKTAEILGDSYDQEIVEMHHRLKIDAPSGTAKRLAEVLVEVKGKAYNDIVIAGRKGEPGQRTRDEIAIHALRGGDVVGDHTVVFAGIGERVELTHKAASRETFAAGALRASAWVKSQKPGLYTMEDVLGLK